MLNARSAIVVHILLDLGPTQTGSRFGARHFNGFIVVAHDDRTKTRVFGVNLIFIDRPETVELKITFVPVGCSFHFEIGLIADAMIDADQIGGRQKKFEWILVEGWFEAGQEESFVSIALDECVRRITVLQIDL